MKRFSAILGAAFLAALLLSGCSYSHRHAQRKPPATAGDRYSLLAQKAEAGDAKAARALARYCYLHDETNERARYWMRVAARHGDSGAAKLADYTKDWR